MCGRATLTIPGADLAALFEAEPIDIGPARYNIAPTQPILTVRETVDGRNLTLMRWGLIPWWAKPDEAKKIGVRGINARAETVKRAPQFRDAFARHRCLVVFDGFYEWKTLPDGRKVPHHIHRSSHEPLAIAGLWDRWGEERIESAAVVTTNAKEPVADLHDRMPLILPKSAWSTWLAGSPDDAAELVAKGPDAEGLVALPVSSWVNDYRHEDPRCVEPVPIEEALAGSDFTFDRPRRKKAR